MWIPFQLMQSIWYSKQVNCQKLTRFENPSVFWFNFYIVIVVCLFVFQKGICFDENSDDSTEEEEEEEQKEEL